MKVIYLHQYFNTANSAGGTRSYEFARRLVRDGHEVHIVTSDRAESTSPKSWVITEVEGVTVHSIGQPYSSSMGPRKRIGAFLGFALQAARRARSLRGDIVFATSTPLTIVLPAFAAVFGRRTPFVMEVRDLWPTVPIALGYLRNPGAQYLARGLERLAYARASKIVALSEGMAEGIRRAGGSAEKITVIPNMSDTKRFQVESNGESWFRRRHPQLGDRPFVVYTGAFGHVNGVDYMARLASHYAAHDPQLAFVCVGDGAQRDSVLHTAENLGVLGKNFFVFDAVPKKHLPLILAEATACSSWVIPVAELEANSANKLFDAFAAGRPMLINHGGWQKQLLESTGAGIALSATDLASAAKRLSEYVRDEGWLEHAGEASARLGREQFEAEKLYSDFALVLESALSEEAR